MKLKLKPIILTATLLLALAGAFAAQPETAMAIRPSTDEACDAIGDCDTGEEDLQSTLSLVVNIFSVLIGIVAVIMIIVGGFKYITSGGDSQKVASAKNTVIYAVIGLVIVALAQFIVHFVLANTLGSPAGGSAADCTPAADGTPRPC